jgi:hypothetical protein
MDEDDRLIEAMRDTLLHVAAVSGAAAKRLRPGRSLVADLGLDDVDLEVLAGAQRKLGDRLRHDHGTTRIEADELYDLTVEEVFALTLQRAIGRAPSATEVTVLFSQAQAGLRGASG